MTQTERHDVIVVGAGFSGLYLLHQLRTRGFDCLLIEAAPGVGGTWFWNRYPGARCDIPSVEYSYSFSPDLEREWQWTERYAAQPEILRYLEHVADRFDLRRDIRLSTRVMAAQWDEDADLWHVSLDTGECVDARHLIMATGCLSAPKLPEWPGIERFTGTIMHTGHWDAGVSLEGKRVAVVGTGSSGVQVIPQIAQQAQHLTVFQRTPNFAVPASNRPLDPAELAALAPRKATLREAARQSPLGWFDGPCPGSAKAADAAARMERFEQQWNAGTTGLLLAFEDLLVDEESNALAADFARGKIRELVKDPETARKLTPLGFPIGSRRLCSEIGFYEAMNRENVSLVDVREDPVVEVTAQEIVTASGRHPVDVIVFATGFFAMTGAISAIDVRGAGGLSLKEEWAEAPRSYLGLAVAGFPNLFTVTGPGSPSVLSNVVVSIEQHVDWIADCLAAMRENGLTRIEADAEAEQAWMEHVDEVAWQTLFPRGPSWYQGRTRDGRSVFMPYVGGVGAYRARCDEVAAQGYAGFRLDGPAAPVAQDGAS
ncbi:MAG: flavin-containing monooxygenase [Novosphingobium sp.]